MTGDYQGRAIASHHLAHRPRRARRSDACGKLPVSHRLPVGDTSAGLKDVSLKIRGFAQVDLNIGKVFPVAVGVLANANRKWLSLSEVRFGPFARPGHARQGNNRPPR
jgi:hypothetical protein